MVATMAETILGQFFCITAQFCLYHIVNKKKCHDGIKDAEDQHSNIHDHKYNLLL